MKYVTTREASSRLSVTPQTLRNWAKEGSIKYIRVPSGHRRYDIDSVAEVSKGQEKSVLH